MPVPSSREGRNIHSLSRPHKSPLIGTFLLLTSMYYIYILQSEIDSSFYIGYTENPNERLHKHNTAKSGYTSRKQPWTLKYSEQFESKTDALKREKFLKRQKSRKFYQKLIDDFPG